LKTFIERLKKHPTVLLASTLSSLLLFFLFQNIVFGLLTAFISLLLSLFFLKKTDEELDSFSLRTFSLSFFSSFLTLIKNGQGSKSSYEYSTRYLLGKTTIEPYENILETGNPHYDFGKYTSFFKYMIQKDRENQIHLPNTEELIIELDEVIVNRKNKIIKMKKRQTDSELCLLICLFLLVIIFSVFSTIRKSLDSLSSNIIVLISLSLLFPCLLFFDYLNLRKENGNA